MSRIRAILEQIQKPKQLNEAVMKPDAFLKALKEVINQFSAIDKEIAKANKMLDKMGASYSINDVSDDMDLYDSLKEVYETVYDSLEDDEKAQQKFENACEEYLPI